MISLRNIGKIQDTSTQLIDALDKKYHNDFDVIQFEFGKVAEESHKQEDKLKEMQTYINSLEQKLGILEKRVAELEEREDKANQLQDKISS